MTIKGILKGLVFQTVLIAGVSLLVGFHLLEGGGPSPGFEEYAQMAMLWPLELAVHYDWLLENPLAHPLEKFWPLATFVQFTGFYVVLWIIHMSVKGLWGKNPRRQPKADFQDPRDLPDPDPEVQYNLNPREEKKE